MTPDGSTTAPTTSAAEPDPAPHMTAVQLRRLTYLPIFDLSTGHGLEIGPLASPIADPATADVHFVDVIDRDELVGHYGGDPAVDCDEIPEIHYWLKGPDGFRTLSDAVAPGAPYDWVVAAHVVEHIPDLIGWFVELGRVLRDGGHVILTVPDRRFSFDILRPGTTTSQVLAAHASSDVVPSPRAAFDHFRGHVVVGADRAWDGWVPSADTRTYTLGDARGMARRAADGEYVDSHVWTFTPTSFVEQVDELGLLGMIDFTITDIVPTRRNELEFYVVLERLATDGDPAAREEQRRSGMVRARAALPPEDLPSAVGESPTHLADLRLRLEELPGAAAQLREDAARLRADVAARDDELHRLRTAHHDVLASNRWRVGGMVAAPVAALRRRLRR